ncbi:unnamed protein product [Hymenolepis diminuta]|uniref:Proteasome assembly chaperone 2 n=1 Tax=Hymenolepis diminuta TaxID=6216 RepID=A0A0R3SQ48_HYMDI|nr:unnamed protein product [Hymenolepis diminuta]VUZ53481.1 unnamed protein product [Hymenolepis diminuta]
MCILVPSNVDCSLKVRDEYALIIACVGVGNVGQLCMDVLISSLEPVFVGYLNSPSVPPIVGSSPYPELTSSPPLACSLELYDDDSRKLSFLQVRVPVFSGARDQFGKEIAHFVSEQKFSRVILLSSSFAMTRKDQQLRGPPLQFTSTHPSDDLEALSRIGLTQLVQEEVVDYDSPNGRMALNLPGSGATLCIYSSLEKMKSVPTTLLNMFTCDGDNRNDAFFMAHAINGWLKINPAEGVEPWRTPECWKMLFGSACDPALY